MNEIVDKFLLAKHKFMPETHLRQHRFIYSVCGPLTNNKKRIQKFKGIEDSQYIYQNKLSKLYFQHDMAYRRTWPIARRTASDKVLREKVFNIAKKPKI